jgi:predicted transcriptional regulator
MPDRLVYETFDRFTVAYDILVLVHEKNVASESAIASAAHISPSAVESLMSFLLLQGFIRTAAGSDSEFKITTLGANFLEEFHGMRKFLS